MLGLLSRAPHLTMQRRGVEYSLIGEAHCSRPGTGVDGTTRRGMRDDTADHPEDHARICPFLGAQERAGTRHCHAQPDDPIQIDSRYVDEFCLTVEHKQCTLYLRADALPARGESAEHGLHAMVADQDLQSRPVPTITSPPDGASVTAEELIISGTGEPGDAVRLFRRDTLVARYNSTG